MYQLNIVDCMLLWMDLFLRRIVEIMTDDKDVLAAHNSMPHVAVVFYIIVADNSMVEMHTPTGIAKL